LQFRSESRGSGGGGGGGGERKTVAITDHINKDNKDKTLVMKGMPFKATESEVKEFFEGFDLDTDDSIYLDQENGRKSGKGAVVFKSEDVAQEAKDALNKKEIGAHGRYVILCDQYDDFF
jgi:heterogeneous nuclear ribonucleoprotein F/H/epithelial splicing regulatory protein 1/2